MILRTSLSASILILAIVAVRAVMLNRLPKKAFLALWCVALCRLFIPFNLPSSLSIFTLINKAMQFLGRQGVSATAANEITVRPPILASNDTTIGAEVSPFLAIWLIGLVVTALFFITTHLRCKKGYKMALPLENAVITKWQQAYPMKRIVQIKQSDRITAPLTYGILAPIILLPRTMNYDDKQQLQYVLAHEYTHIKQFDILLKWLLVTALCVHWFNPLVWVMFILASRDIELSCDETVVMIFGEVTKLAYSLALINLEEKKRELTPLCSHFSKNAVEERINAIMKIKKITMASTIFATALVLCTTMVFATSATKPASRITPTYEVMTTNANYVLKPSFATTDSFILDKNNTIGEHNIPLNGTAVYYGSERPEFSFTEGERKTISLKIVDRKFDYGQGVHMGYIIDGNRTQLFSGQVKKGVTTSFKAPKEGNYIFYIECASSNPLLVEKVSIN